MTIRLTRVPSFVIVAVALVLLATLVVVPRVSGQEPRTVTFDTVDNGDSVALLPAPGHYGGFPPRAW